MNEVNEPSPYGDTPPENWWLNAIMDPRDVFPPDRDEIIRGLMLTGDALTSDFDRLKFHLDRIASVRGTFEITSTPRGFAPEDVRRQWIGVTLPMRGYFDPSEGVSVLAREALELLKLKSPEAHKWWQQYYADEAEFRIPNVDPEDLPEFLANISHLVFDLDCGTPQLLSDTPIDSEIRKVDDI